MLPYLMSQLFILCDSTDNLSLGCLYLPRVIGEKWLITQVTFWEGGIHVTPDKFNWKRDTSSKVTEGKSDKCRRLQMQVSWQFCNGKVKRVDVWLDLIYWVQSLVISGGKSRAGDGNRTYRENKMISMAVLKLQSKQLSTQLKMWNKHLHAPIHFQIK